MDVCIYRASIGLWLGVCMQGEDWPDVRPDPRCPLAFGNIDPFLHGINLLFLPFKNSQGFVWPGCLFSEIEWMKCVFCPLSMHILNLRVVLCCSKHGCELFLLHLGLFARQLSKHGGSTTAGTTSSSLTELFHSHSVISSNFSARFPRLTQKKPGPLAVAGPAAVTDGSVSASHTSFLTATCLRCRFHSAILNPAPTFLFPLCLLFAVTQHFSRGLMTMSHQSAVTGCVCNMRVQLFVLC